MPSSFLMHEKGSSKSHIEILINYDKWKQEVVHKIAINNVLIHVHYAWQFTDFQKQIRLEP